MSDSISFNRSSANGPAFIRHLDIVDHSDYVFYAALLLLPVDGTVLGFYMPFWTPISPWLFMVYVLLNRSLLPQVRRRFRTFFLLPVALFALSIVGWVTFAFHILPALWSFLEISGALACLSALEIAIRIKRLDWRDMIRTLIAVYWVAFAIGVVQFLAIKLDVPLIRDWFSHLMSREYITSDSQWGGDRPQFLFAEPSYIGMHLYGVLLPLMWIMCDHDRIYMKRLRDLIVVFAVGAILMGAGIRIIIDTGVALVITLAMHTDFHNRGQAKRTYEVFGVMFVAGVVIGALNSRIRSILMQGPIAGDGSTSSRIAYMLNPFIAGIMNPFYAFVGFGAGNLSEVEHTVRQSEQLIPGISNPGPTWWWLKTVWRPDSVRTGTITMSAYSSLIGEFGLIGFIALAAVIIRYVREQRPWNRMIVCWLILTAYLYVQFEGYAFYALPLFIWTIGTGTSDAPSRSPVRRNREMETSCRR